jgi:cathepsin X
MKLVPSLHPFGEICREIDQFPNATIAEYGVIQLEDETDEPAAAAAAVMHKVKAEVFARGPVAAAINGVALHTYQGGIFNDATASQNTTHIVSIVGWGVVDADPANDNNSEPSYYYIARNSWGAYWGEVR